jgi:hypothetical protein
MFKWKNDLVFQIKVFKRKLATNRNDQTLCSLELKCD